MHQAQRTDIAPSPGTDVRPPPGAPRPSARNVLIVSHYFPPHSGGIECVAYNEAKHLAEAGADVAVLTSHPGRKSGTERRNERFTVTRVRAWNGLEGRWGVPFPFFAPSFVVRSWRLVRWADVVHIHDSLYMSSWAAALWCWLLGRPLVVTQHVHLVPHPRRLVESIERCVYLTAGRMVLRIARVVAVLNSGVQGFLTCTGVRSERICVLPNGVDTSLFFPARDGEKQAIRRRLGLPESRTLALFVGRFVPKKGFDTVFQATSDDYTLVLAGGRPPDPVGKDERLVLLGSMTPAQLSRVYRACDIFILPSEGEGFPLTVQEAMASGLPVITTDDPGYGVYGLDHAHVRLIQPTVDEVREALAEIAGDPALRARMSAYSLNFVRQNFTWPAHVARLQELYERAVNDAAA